MNTYDRVSSLMDQVGLKEEKFDPHKRFTFALGHVLKAKKKVETTEQQSAHIPLKYWPRQRREVLGFEVSHSVNQKWKKLMRDGWTKIWFIQTRDGKRPWITWNGGEKAYTCRTYARRDAIALHADGEGPDTRIVRWTHESRKDLQWAYLRVRIFRIYQHQKEQKFNSLPEEMREWRKAQEKLNEVKQYLNRFRSRTQASRQAPTSQI